MDDFIDLLSNYNPRIQKIENKDKRDFIETCLNSDELFVVTPEMENDQSEKHKVETLKLTFNPERFLTARHYTENNLGSILKPEKLDLFVAEVLNGKRPLYWASEPTPSVKYS